MSSSSSAGTRIIVVATRSAYTHHTQKIDELDLLLFTFRVTWTLAVVHVDHHHFRVSSNKMGMPIYIERYTHTNREIHPYKHIKIEQIYTNNTPNTTHYLVYSHTSSIHRHICLPSLHNICLTRTDIYLYKRYYTNFCTNQAANQWHAIWTTMATKMNDARVLIKYWSASLLKYLTISFERKTCHRIWIYD